MKSYFFIILGMAVVTFIPRLLPFIFISKKEIHPTLKRFLNYIPYATLGALILPGVFNAIPNQPKAVWAGIVTAVFLSWWKGNIILSVLASVGISFLMIQYF
ncbi:MAG TPA: AzlD domain-containing protein [Defluviitaleaceae bacterium]|jgi:branched-subunit amino acid transport protein|nr:AzlD domain-containing protein [Candidatus Epulonipiscium sp.]HOQ16744.1 AzlD domain-containing protein [Defluviitaleaceae bacterium]HPT75939.1 AzlD domain-containing protein [Defluviitaleaceae bacterium]HQD51288.1 AzlD domain-containing protein [Defluviitaleaceae bacterium]